MFFNPITSINANVSPGESGSFNSSKPITDPFVSLGRINSRHFFVGSYISKSKYAREMIVSGLFFR